MTIIQTMPSITTLADAKARLSEIVRAAQDEHERTVITRNGRPAAVLISVDDLESLEETVELLSDPDAMTSIREGEAELARGEQATIEDVVADLAKRSRG